jgi:hypothetical protein
VLEMNFSNLLIVIGIIAVIWYVTTTIIIYENLRKRNIKVCFLLLRFLAPHYANQYKEITFNETGKIGPLFYHWIISINTALAVAILFILQIVI